MQESEPIWAYVGAAEFEVPAPPASDAARGRMVQLWKSIQRVFHRPAIPTSNGAVDPTRWNRLSLDWLQAACPHFQWSQAAESLSESLGEAWFADTCPERPLRVLVGPPGSGIRRVLQELAEVRQLRLLPAPQAEEILASAPGDTALLRAAEPDAGEILVIPNLECWYLRHPNGLALVRNLVEWLSGFRGRVLVGCDSWAWAFLQRAAGIEDLLGEPQTLASFNARRLDAWFRDTLELPLPAFRQRGGAEAVFPLADDEGARPAGRAEGEVSSLIRSLAVRARGNPGVALALWRTSLRERETSDSAGASKVSGAEQAAGKDKATATETPPSTPSSDVWVVPSAKLDMPQFPADYDRIHRFVLHALLLHGGLTLPLLAQLLPFARHELQRRVRGLHRAGLLDLPQQAGNAAGRQGRLRVALEAYPLVRQDLRSEGFLTDAF